MSNDFELPASSIKTRPAKEPRRAKAASATSSPLFPPAEQSKPSAINAEDLPDAQSEEVEEAPAKKSKYSEEELLQIFDHILFSGNYTEEVTIKGRLSVTFITRTGEQVQDIQRKLDKSGIVMITTMEQERSLLNLEASLLDVNGKDLSGLQPEEKSRFIRSLPAPVLSLISTALQEFDTKIMEACSEGSENF